jgi:hypothetical protein
MINGFIVPPAVLIVLFRFAAASYAQSAPTFSEPVCAGSGIDPHSDK